MKPKRGFKQWVRNSYGVAGEFPALFYEKIPNVRGRERILRRALGCACSYCINESFCLSETPQGYAFWDSMVGRFEDGTIQDSDIDYFKRYVKFLLKEVFNET